MLKKNLLQASFGFRNSETEFFPLPAFNDQNESPLNPSEDDFALSPENNEYEPIIKKQKVTHLESEDYYKLPISTKYYNGYEPQQQTQYQPVSSPIKQMQYPPISSPIKQQYYVPVQNPPQELPTPRTLEPGKLASMFFDILLDPVKALQTYETNILGWFKPTGTTDSSSSTSTSTQNTPNVCILCGGTHSTTDEVHKDFYSNLERAKTAFDTIRNNK